MSKQQRTHQPIVPGQELTELPLGYKPVLKHDKRKIQVAYLDLLFYEYREEQNFRSCVVAICLFLAGVALWFLPEFTREITWLLLVGGGIGALVADRRGRRFHVYARNLKTELEKLGIGVVGKQLRDQWDSTAFGELIAHTVSGLGIVHPVSETYGPDMLVTIDIFKDEVYR